MTTIRINIPTILTFSRIVLIPFFVVITPGNPFLGVTIFLIASITDFLDGYLARRSDQVTKFGIILDPIADKILVISALVLLVDMVRLPAWVAIVMIGREFVVTTLRLVALAKGIVIPAERGGKFKTAMQMTAIVLLLLPLSIGDFDLYDVGLVLMYVALALALVSGYRFLVAFWRQIQ